MSTSQEWIKSKEVRFKKQPTAYTVDFQNNFYVGFADGGLMKYKSEGKLLENYSLSNTSSITLIDVQNNLKPFLFYFDNQQITILDRFSTVPKIYVLADFGIQLGMMACPAPDGDIWVVENNPQRLKKISPLRKSTVLEVQLILGDSINRMQAYQNLLYISHENGLQVLDQFGGEIFSISSSNMDGFQLLGDQLILFSKNDIMFVDSTDGRKLGSLRLPDEGNVIFKLKESYLLLKERSLSFYDLND